MNHPSPSGDLPITYRLSPPVTSDALNRLFEASWPDHAPRDFAPVLAHSLAYVCAFAGTGENVGGHERLVGFANLAWDGGCHAFLLDPTVHPDYQRRGVGRELVRRAVDAARGRGVEWVHVDYEPALRDFYRACGFRPTEAGLMHLDPPTGLLPSR